MKKLLIATGNLNKAREIIKILPQAGIWYLTLKDFPAIKMPAETGKTFRENAVLKARSACRQSGLTALADDSGLMVDYLSGAPGIYSARYACLPANVSQPGISPGSRGLSASFPEGGNCTYADNNRKLLAELKNIPLEKRTARFICVTALAFPDGKIITERGVLKGHIVLEERGKNGFGYDPLFVPDGLNKTLAELAPEQKNRISHRFLAVKKIIFHLK